MSWFFLLLSNILLKTQEKGSPFYLPMFLLFPSSVFFRETPGSHLLAFLFCLEKRAPFRHSVRIGCVCHSFSHVQLFSTPCTVARQAPLSMGFSRHEYWSGLPFPSPGDLPHPGIEPRSPALQQILYSLSHRGIGWLATNSHCWIENLSVIWII